MKNARLNDEDRAEWVNNDAGLYALWHASGKGITAFVRANRAELDKRIIAIRDAPPPARTWRDYAAKRGTNGST